MHRSWLSAVLAGLLLALAPSSAWAQRAESASGAASSVVRNAELSAQRVARLLDEARASREPERVMCVDARLSQIHSLLRQALERAHRVRVADAAHAERERALIGRLADQIRALERDARACVDPEAAGAERTRVVTTIEPWVPDDAVRPTETRSAFTR